MAQRSAFFDAQNDDRIYASADFARLFASLIRRDGIVKGDADELAVTPTAPASMDVQIGLGSAWIQGRHYQLYGAPELLQIPQADSTHPRIDRIVVRMDTAQAARTITVQVKEGTPDASPVPPSLTRDTEAWEISLAQVFVDANATQIDASDITDERGDATLCGFLVADPTAVFDVTRFGAKGDGVTDDTRAIQAAINAAIDTNGTVWFPTGTFITTELLVSGACTIVLPRGATLKLKSGSDDTLLRITGDYVTVEGGGCIDGNLGNAEAANAMIVNADHVTIRGLEVKNTYKYGIRCFGNYCNILDNYVHDTGNIAIFLEFGASNCLIQGNKVLRTSVEGGIKVHGNHDDVECPGTRIIGNHVEAVAQICIEVWGLSPRSVIQGNVTVGGIMGISVDASDHTTITGNQVYDAASYGIELANSKFCSVTGNTIAGNTVRTSRGILVSNTAPTHNTFQGNNIRYVSRGIHIQSGAYSSVVGNVISDFTSYAINLSAGDFSTIAHNVVSNGGTKVIMIDNSSYITIFGNLGHTTTQHGILLYQSGSGETDHITIVGNRMVDTNVAIGQQGSVGNDIIILPTP